MSYLVSKYAGSLSKEDAEELFSKLVKACGSISEACRKCGIQRKTTYDWPSVKSLKSLTKEKVLKAMLEVDLEEALSFLLSRSKEDTVDLLSTNLSYLYEKAMSEDIGRERFLNAIEKFEEIRQKYAGLVFEELEEEVGDMAHFIKERATELNVPLPTETINTIKSSQILEMLPIVVDAIYHRGYIRDPSELAKDLSVPKELVEVLFGSIRISAGGVKEFPHWLGEEHSPYKDVLPIAGQIPPTANVEYPEIWAQGKATTQN